MSGKIRESCYLYNTGIIIYGKDLPVASGQGEALESNSSPRAEPASTAKFELRCTMGGYMRKYK